MLSAIDETNLAMKKILGFTVGYYGSILKVTGNTSYAKTLAINYLHSGLINIANMHPEWGASFHVKNSRLHTHWFTDTSYSIGNLEVTYNLTGIGIYGMAYENFCRLMVQVKNATSNNQTQLVVLKDENEPLINLGRQNFRFYFYDYENSMWELAIPDDLTAFANGTYMIDIPPGIDPYSYVVQVEDQRGLVVVASSFSRYKCVFAWNSTVYSTLQDATAVVELLQNGTMRWLGQNLQLTTQTKPIPPIPVRSIRVNQTIGTVNQEVPFQIEDWASDYKIPLSSTSNASIFSGRTMLVFLINPDVSNVTIWWDGDDTANQTSYAWRNRYFNDNPNDGVLSNGDMLLEIGKVTEHLYVNSFSYSLTEWSEVGDSPFIDDSDTSHIWDDDNYNGERYFYFEDSSVSSGNVITAKLQFETKCDGNDYFQFRINNGYSTYGWYSITGLPSSYGWTEYDVSSILTSVSRVNNARIEIRYRTSGSVSSDVFIRRCKLVAEIDLSSFTASSTVGSSTSKTEFLRVNGENPVYGADPSYVIYNGSVRDIVQQESEWSGGANNCPNFYAHIVLTLPANATYFTYKIRLMFVESQQSRSISDLCLVQTRATIPENKWGSEWSKIVTENGTSAGIPVTSYGEDFFYNFSDVFENGWAHHWSELVENNSGFGIMMTTEQNLHLYVFDDIAGTETGGIDVDDSRSGDSQTATIEVKPASSLATVSFMYALDLTWCGAIANFDGESPIYPDTGETTGLWVIVEYPPVILVTTEN